MEDLTQPLRDDIDMLKTIHCPRNLSQLGGLLPKSKYQTDQGLKEYANAPYPQLRMDRASSSPDGNKVIELANQIVLPPIREQMDS